MGERVTEELEAAGSVLAPAPVLRHWEARLAEIVAAQALRL